MFHQITFLLLIVSSISWNFNRCAFCFQSFMNIACLSTQNAALIKRFLRLHIVIKALKKKNKHNEFFTVLKRNSIKVHSNTRPKVALQIPPFSKVRSRLVVYIGDFGNFFNGFAKSPRLIFLNID